MSFVHNSLGEGSRTIAAETFTKMKLALGQKIRKAATELPKYQHGSEVTMKEISIMSFNKFARDTCQLTSYEAENIVHYLDYNNSGFLSLVELQSKLE